MTKLPYLMVAIVFASSTLHAEETQTMCVVEIFDHSKNSSHEVLSTDEYEALQKKIDLESKFHRKAIMMATRTWKKESTSKNKAFPKAAIYERKAVLVGKYEDITKAMAKLDSLQRAENERQKEEKKKQDKKIDDMSKYMGGHTNAREKLEKREKAAMEKEAILSEALTFYEMALDELVYAAQNPDAAKE